MRVLSPYLVVFQDGSFWRICNSLIIYYIECAYKRKDIWTLCRGGGCEALL